MNDWLHEQIVKLESLQDKEIKKVVIRDMAFIERVNGDHLFTHPDCPFIQAEQIYLFFELDEVKKIQATDEGCLYVSKVDTTELKSTEDHDSIFRLYECKEFPLGQIVRVALKQNSDMDISEVTITIGPTPVLLKSGEVYETENGGVVINSDDESVLVFLNLSDVNSVAFNA